MNLISDPFEEEIPEPEIKRLALIDGDFIPFYCTVGKKVLDANGEPVKQENGNFLYTEKTLSECLLDAKKILEYTFTNTNVDHYIGVLGKGMSFRKKMYSSYKAHRADKELPKHFNEVRDWLFTYKKFISIDDLEADDVVNILRYKLRDQYTCIIVSPDQDILSLEGTHYDPKNGIWKSTTKEEAHYKKWIDILKGQSSDGVAGIPKVGIKTAEKILGRVEPQDYRTEVFIEYINYFGEDLGVEEFYKNYKLLTILNDYQLEIPTPVKIRE